MLCESFFLWTVAQFADILRIILNIIHFLLPWAQESDLYSKLKSKMVWEVGEEKKPFDFFLSWWTNMIKEEEETGQGFNAGKETPVKAGDGLISHITV